MDFLLDVSGTYRASIATNIFSLTHLGIQNTQRMVIIVSGDPSELIAITKRVNELGLCTIKYLGLVNHNQSEPLKSPDYKFHFSLSGTKAYLQTIRDALGLVGEDEEEPIEDFDDDAGVIVAEMGALKLT
jgi:hypothetical protein